MKEGVFPEIPQPGVCQFLRVPGKNSGYCPVYVFFCSDTIKYYCHQFSTITAQ